MQDRLQYLVQVVLSNFCAATRSIRHNQLTEYCCSHLLFSKLITLIKERNYEIAAVIVIKNFLTLFIVDFKRVPFVYSRVFRGISRASTLHIAESEDKKVTAVTQSIWDHFLSVACVFMQSLKTIISHSYS